MSWNIQKPSDYINGPLTVVGATTLNSTLSVAANATFSTQIGIGSAPVSNFKLTAFGSAAGVLINKNGVNQLLAVSMKNNSQDYCLFVDQDGIGSNSWSLFDNTNLHTAQRYYPGASGYWQFLVNGIERLRLNNTGSLLLNGGTTADGIGIAFPAVQVASSNANTLDDYEEGTFTPTITASTGTPTTTTINSATYTKIGRLVSVTVDISIVNIGTASNLLQFTLPFSQGTDNNVGSLREVGATAYMGQFGSLGGSAAFAVLYNNATVWVNGYRIRGTYTYTV